jgi:hypothetical protein
MSNRNTALLKQKHKGKEKVFERNKDTDTDRSTNEVKKCLRGTVRC